MTRRLWAIFLNLLFVGSVSAQNDPGVAADPTPVPEPSPSLSLQRHAETKTPTLQKKKNPRRKVLRRKKKAPPAKTWSEIFGPSGSIRMGYFKQDKSFSSKKDIGYGSLWLAFHPLPLWGWQAFLEGNVQAADTLLGVRSKGDLREATLEQSFGPVDLKLGRQITVWGRADKINPTDNLSTRDYTRLVENDEDQRTGLGAAQITLNYDEFRLISIWQPEWRPPIYALPAPDVGITYQTLTPLKPNEQFGLKLDRSGGAFDFSLSYFSGYDRFPDMKLISMGAAGLELGFEFQKIQVYGLDFAFNLGDFSFRGEGAYSKTRDTDGSDPLTKNSFTFAVFGTDYSLTESLNINFQYLYRSIDRWVDPTTLDPVTGALATQVQILSNQQNKVLHGASTRIAYRLLNDSLELEVTYLKWFFKSDSLVRSKMTYALTDNFKICVGGESYFGPKDSFLGQFRDLSSIFTEFRYSF